MDDIRDIKPLIAIEDYSLIIFIIVIMVGLVVFYFAFKKAYEYSKTHCKIDCQKYYFVQYCNVDWNNPKKAAYEATKYGYMLAQDKRRIEIFTQLRERLDRYKYVKNIDKVDEETLNYYNLYKQVCDESI